MSKEKKIPTIVAIFILIIVVFVTTYLTKLTAIFTSKASNGCSPISIQITNLTDHSVDLSFLTPEKCSVNLGINNQLVLDSFQLIEPQSQIHYFQVNGLKENSSYQYTIIANGKEIENDQFVISTPAKLDGPIPDSNLAWGKIIQSNQQPASIAILYLNIPSSAPMSSFVTSEGNWNIPLSISYNTQKSSWFVPPENVEEEIAVLSKDGQVTLVTGNTSNNNPVPDIIIGHGFSSDENNNREQDIGNMPVTQQQPDQAIEKELDII
ncbi:hypothetical protein KKC08_01415, partial [Patescibacteria group bacterium]|nr:hypothetical protein [Patescibacteria group bacterium]